MPALQFEVRRRQDNPIDRVPYSLEFTTTELQLYEKQSTAADDVSAAAEPQTILETEAQKQPTAADAVSAAAEPQARVEREAQKQRDKRSANKALAAFRSWKRKLVKLVLRTAAAPAPQKVLTSTVSAKTAAAPVPQKVLTAAAPPNQAVLTNSVSAKIAVPVVTNVFTPVGIKVSWILDYFCEHPAVKRLRNPSSWPSTHVVTTYDLKPLVMHWTEDHECSLAELARRHDPSAVKDVAEVFVSHAWLHPLDKTLAIFGSSSFDRDDYIFMDIFCLNQHRAKAYDYFESFKRAKDLIGRVRMILYPSNQPIVFTRMWCVYEAFLFSDETEDEGAFDVVVAPDDERDFRQQLFENPAIVLDRYSMINIEKAEAEVKQDKEGILKAIENSKRTNQEVEDVVMSRVHFRLASIALSMAKNAESRERNPQRLLEILDQTKTVLQSQGRYSDASSVIKKILSIVESNPSMSYVRLRVLGELSRSLALAGNNEEALHYIDEALLSKRADEDIPAVQHAGELDLKSQISYIEQDLVRSRIFYEKALSYRRDHYLNGTRHASSDLLMHPMLVTAEANGLSLSSNQRKAINEFPAIFNKLCLYGNDAAGNANVGKAICAFLSYGSSAAITENVSRSYLPLITAAGNYAILLRQEGYAAESRRILQEVVRIKREIFSGSSNVHVASSMNALANVHFDLGNLDPAKALYKQIIKVCRGDQFKHLKARVHWNLSLLLERQEDKDGSARELKHAIALHGIFSDTNRPQLVADIRDIIQVPATAHSLLFMTGEEHVSLFVSCILIPYGGSILQNKPKYDIDPLQVCSLIEVSLRRNFGAGFVPCFSTNDVINVILPSLRNSLRKVESTWAKIFVFNVPDKSRHRFTTIPVMKHDGTKWRVQKNFLTLFDIFLILFDVDERHGKLEYFPEENIWLTHRQIADPRYAAAFILGSGLAFATWNSGIGGALMMKNLAMLGGVANGLNIVSNVSSLVVLAILNETLLKEQEGESARMRHARREAKTAAVATAVAAGALTMFAIATGGVGPAGLAAVGNAFGSFMGGPMVTGATTLAFGSGAATVTVATGTTLAYMPSMHRPSRKEADWSIDHQLFCQQQDMEDVDRFIELLEHDFKENLKRIQAGK